MTSSVDSYLCGFSYTVGVISGPECTIVVVCITWVVFHFDKVDVTVLGNL